MKGQCLCGAVSFEIEGKLPNLYQCHCSLCRKVTGAAANAATIVAESAFRWLSGQDRIRSFSRSTGYRSDFCSVCGSPVPNKLNVKDRFWVPAGLLDDARDLAVAVHIHLTSAAAWEHDAQRCLHWPEGPPDLASLERALQRSEGDRN
ncbi:MAG: aldehyde-activating protein [unclassified Hahellaceae]|nr:aldehyde-activating protein [Hahellaceae bacterium]